MDDEEKGLKSGAVDYITKPIGLQKLNARISVQIRMKQLHDRYKKQVEIRTKSLHEVSLWAETEHERLRQENNNFSAVINSIDEIVTIGDEKRKIIWANKTALAFFNTSLLEIVGRHCYEVLQNTNTVCKKCPLLAKDIGELSKPIVMHRENFDQPPFQQIHILFFDADGEYKGFYSTEIMNGRTGVWEVKVRRTYIFRDQYWSRRLDKKGSKQG